MMARKLPSDLEEEILVRVPPLSLVRFRSVCKEWNNLFKNKRFVNKNFACSRQEFMLKTHSKIYSISVNLSDDPTIKVRDLCFGLRGNHRFYHYGTCDGYFFMYDFYKGGVVWNPLLRHIKWVAEARKSCGKSMGYDGNRPEKSTYKIIGIWSVNRTLKVEVVSEFATKAWKVTDHHHTSYLEMSKMANDSYSSVSLNGNVYWPAHNKETGEFFIRILDYSKEIVKPFCILPCKAKKKSTHSRVLSLYKGDRFSVLEQCKSTREIEIWVTKKKIGNGDDVVWIKFMTISIPNFPIVSHTSSSYFVDNNIYGKSYVVCCRSKKPAQAWVYIVKGDMCKKIKIDGVLTSKFQSSVYCPSLITIP